MAIVTRVASTVAHSDGTVARLEYDYDDGDLRIRTIRCINETPRTARVLAARTNGTRQHSADTAPRATRTVNVPTTAANRLQLVVDQRGRLDGVDFSFSLVG